MIPKLTTISLIVAFLLLVPFVTTATTVEKVVATVDGEPITLYDLDEAVKTIGPEIQKTENISGEALRARVLDKLIDNKVMENALKENKITVEPHEIDQHINRVLRSSMMSMEQLKNELRKKGMTMSQFRSEISKQLKRDKFLEREVSSKINISEAELKDYFTKHMDEFHSRTSVQLAQITLPFTKETKREDVEKMMKFALNIKKAAVGTNDFDALAKRFNGHPYKVDGSNLGMLNMKDLQPAIANTSVMLDIGQVSEPFMSGAGIHLIKVINRPAISTKDFQDVRDDVYNAVYNIKMQKSLKGYIKQLRREASIEIKSLR